MRKPRKVTLLKSGNRLVVNPTTTRIYDLLAPKLTFTEKRFLYGEERFFAESNIETIDWECFGEDSKGRMAFPFGFWKRVKDRLTKAGYKVVFKDLTPHPNPEAFKPHWDRLKDYDLRHGQDQFLLKILANRCGRFDCPPGYGKSFLMGLTALLLPKANIGIVTKRVAVAKDRIYPELCGMLPSVGIVGGGKQRKGRRVMVYTAGSFHHSDGDEDILFGDECHELAADNLAHKLGRADSSRNFGLSATHDMRLDGKDLRVEGIFGPLLYEIPYEEAEEHGMVVPINILWRPVIMDMDPCEGTRDVEKKRLGIWTNNYRNDLIANDARSYDDDTQVLITTESIEHAVNLKSRLPEYKLVHMEDGMHIQDRRWYIKHGLLSPDEPILDRARRDKLTNAFERGKLKKAICTTVWNVGVSFNKLQVLIRADAGGSPIMDTQIPGRVSRIEEGKEYGIVHDYMDQFSTSFRRKALGRQKSYESNGWEQHFPHKPSKTSLRGRLGLPLDDEDEE
jgi:superfamily II DNA or RNA helicase